MLLVLSPYSALQPDNCMGIGPFYLAISLTGVAFRLPDQWFRRQWRPLVILLLCCMPLIWLISSVLGRLILGSPLLQALLLGALITPTDPVVSPAASSQLSWRMAFNWLICEEAGHDEIQHELMQEIMKRFLDVPVFLFFGVIIPLAQWLQAGWPLLFFAGAILLLRRLPVLLLLYPFLQPLKTFRDALFVGWFGPVAVAAMVYVTWANIKQGYAQLWFYGSLVISLSVIVHGVTATPFTRLYARHFTPNDQEASQHPARSQLHAEKDGDRSRNKLVFIEWRLTAILTLWVFFLALLLARLGSKKFYQLTGYC